MQSKGLFVGVLIGISLLFATIAAAVLILVPNLINSNRNSPSPGVGIGLLVGLGIAAIVVVGCVVYATASVAGAIGVGRGSADKLNPGAVVIGGLLGLCLLPGWLLLKVSQAGVEEPSRRSRSVPQATPLVLDYKRTFGNLLFPGSVTLNMPPEPWAHVELQLPTGTTLSDARNYYKLICSGGSDAAGVWTATALRMDDRRSVVTIQGRGDAIIVTIDTTVGSP